MTKDRSTLMEALATLETSLETPFVPGELVSWSRAVRTALDSVDPLLQREMRDVHAPEFEQIGAEDPGLLQRVEQMRKADDTSLETLASLRRTVHSLAKLSSDIEPDETKFKEELDDLVQRGLEFVIHVRSQEVALRTWLLEAFDRDRGTVD